MRRFALALLAAVGCTSAEPPSDLSAAYASIVAAEASTGHDPIAVPITPPGHTPTSTEAWVWVEGEAASRSCVGGCTGSWRAPIDDHQPRWRQSVSIESVGRGGVPTVSRYDEHGAVVWQHELAAIPGGGPSHLARVVECETRIFAVVESTAQAWYRLYVLRPDDGEPLTQQDVRHGDEPIDDHRVQVACGHDDLARVFGRTHTPRDASLLYVDELQGNGSKPASRTILGRYAGMDPIASARWLEPVVGDTELRYKLIGGEDRPWVIGVGRDGKVPRAPKRLLVEAISGDWVRWTAELGPAVRSDVQIIEAGAMTVVRIGPRLHAFDRATGRTEWTSRVGGARQELQRRPGAESGLWGCSRCREPLFSMRVESGALVVSETVKERWVNVVQPRDGDVIVRRMWW